MCRSDATLEAVGSSYLVSMPGEETIHTGGKSVTCHILA